MSFLFHILTATLGGVRRTVPRPVETKGDIMAATTRNNRVRKVILDYMNESSRPFFSTTDIHDMLLYWKPKALGSKVWLASVLMRTPEIERIEMSRSNNAKTHYTFWRIRNDK